MRPMIKIKNMEVWKDLCQQIGERDSYGKKWLCYPAPMEKEWLITALLQLRCQVTLNRQVLIIRWK